MLFCSIVTAVDRRGYNFVILVFIISLITVVFSDMAKLVKFGPAIRELRVHLCQTSPSSKGVRDFIEKFYVPLKKNNPNFPILIRECEGVQPKLWARYGLGKEECVNLRDLKAEEVMSKIDQLSSKC